MKDSMDTKAIIFDIERNTFVDGPGIRTAVFFSGCNLGCRWCHNPEGRDNGKKILFYKSKCTGCGRCKDLTVSDEDFICLNGAKEICGKEYTIDGIFCEIVKDKSFYLASGGGVTFSGGECMLQIEFLEQLLKKCNSEGIHTAIDTAGHIEWDSFEKILPYTDIFLYDMKAASDEIHKEYIGVSNKLILSNLAKLLKIQARVWVRIPVIPSVNASVDEFEKIKAFFDQNGYPEKIELLPYHDMGGHKYAALGKEFVRFDAPSKEEMDLLKGVLNYEGAFVR